MAAPRDKERTAASHFAPMATENLLRFWVRFYRDKTRRNVSICENADLRQHTVIKGLLTVSAVVEVVLPKLDVGGSNPLARFLLKSFLCSRLRICCIRFLVPVLGRIRRFVAVSWQVSLPKTTSVPVLE